MALYYNLQQAAVELRNGTFTIEWGRWFQFLFSQVDTLTTTVNGVIGVNEKTYTQLNALNLGAGDAGYLAFEPNYGHLLRWTGSVWQFAPGDDGNLYFADFAAAPQQVGWALCDGSATDYLVVGGVTLSVSAITPPNLTTGAYRKGAAAYTGTVNAATGSTDASSASVSGSTGDETGHVHTYDAQITTSTAANLEGAGGSSGSFLYGTSHAHTTQAGTTNGGSAHHHDAGSLTADNHSHGVGSLDMRHLGVLPYVRR